MNKNHLPVYPAENAIADLIDGKVEAGVSFVLEDKGVDVESLTQSYIDSNTVLNAEVKDKLLKADHTQDVMALSSILVSSFWNRNDDIFTPIELIKAVNTPKFKPINWMHRGSEVRGNEVIGVMINSSLVRGRPGNFTSVAVGEIDDLMDDHDGNLHLRQDGLIWSFYFPTYAEAIRKGMIENKLFVSMECLYADFGYAIKPEGDSDNRRIRFLQRNKETAGFSTSLRAFGGDGTIDMDGSKYKIGRWLLNVNFSGQGIVGKPANATEDNIPLSVILKDIDEKTRLHLDLDSLKNELLVYKNIDLENSEGNGFMTTSHTSTASVDDTMRNEINDLRTERDALAQKVADLEGGQMSAEIEQLNTIKRDLETKNAELEAKVTELEAKVEAAKEDQSKLEKVEAEYDNLKTELDNIRAIELGRDRHAQLSAFKVELDYSNEDLANMSEETFAGIVKTAEVFSKAAVSSQPYTTDQGVSSQSKSTDQGVSSETKLTEASEVSDEVDEVTEALDTAEVTDSASMVVSATVNSDIDNAKVAKALLSKVMSK